MGLLIRYAVLSEIQKLLESADGTLSRHSCALHKPLNHSSTVTSFIGPQFLSAYIIQRKS